MSLRAGSGDPRELQPQVGFDQVDALPLTTLMPDIYSIAGTNARDIASGIFNEGARGPACRRLLARDIVLSRTLLRTTQGLRNIILRAVAEGREGPGRLRIIERAVEADHRRLLAAIELLARLEGGSPVVRVSAHQAAVVINHSANK